MAECDKFAHLNNPFLSELSVLDTLQLCDLVRILSGGSWLKQVRRELNMRTMYESDFIRSRVSMWDWRCITGRY